MSCWAVKQLKVILAKSTIAIGLLLYVAFFVNGKPAAAMSDAVLIRQLKNMTYRVPGFGDGGSYQVKLNNGSYLRGEESGGIREIALGDINGDGAKDAAIYFHWTTGGSGIWGRLLILKNENGKYRQFKQVAAFDVQDRDEIESLAIKNGRVEFATITHSANEAALEPSLWIMHTYVPKLKKNGSLAFSVKDMGKDERDDSLHPYIDLEPYLQKLDVAAPDLSRPEFHDNYYAIFESRVESDGKISEVGKSQPAGKPSKIDQMVIDHLKKIGSLSSLPRGALAARITFRVGYGAQWDGPYGGAVIEYAR